jgi:hypothetical protein
MQIEGLKTLDDSAARKAELDSRESIAGAQIAKDVFEAMLEAELKGMDMQTREVMEGARLGEKFAEALLKGEQEKEKEREISGRVRRDRED